MMGGTEEEFFGRHASSLGDLLKEPPYLGSR